MFELKLKTWIRNHNSGSSSYIKREAPYRIRLKHNIHKSPKSHKFFTNSLLDQPTDTIYIYIRARARLWAKLMCAHGKIRGARILKELRDKSKAGLSVNARPCAEPPGPTLGPLYTKLQRAARANPRDVACIYVQCAVARARPCTKIHLWFNADERFSAGHGALILGVCFGTSDCLMGHRLFLSLSSWAQASSLAQKVGCRILLFRHYR